MDNLKPYIEGLKEVGRYVILFLISGLLVQLTGQITNVPESTSFAIWVFTVTIPVRMTFQLVFTALGRFIDKALYEAGKISGDKNFLTKIMSLGK